MCKQGDSSNNQIEYIYGISELVFDIIEKHASLQRFSVTTNGKKIKSSAKWD